MKPPCFFTDSGKEVPALTTAQMREVDRIAIQETGPNLFQMIENAGRSLAEMALERLAGDWQNARIVVLAGTGGNGGGGITAARHLANRGARVELCLAVPDRLSEVAAWQRKVFQSTTGKEVEFRNLDSGPVRLIFDALIGYGLQSAPEGVFAALIRWANGTRAPIISLDVPSGRDSTIGATPGEFIWPSQTMTLALRKTGLAQQGVGELVLADIGIPEETYRRIGVSYVSLFGNRFRVPLFYRNKADTAEAGGRFVQGSRRKTLTALSFVCRAQPTAIFSYSRMIRWTRGGDPRTRRSTVCNSERQRICLAVFNKRTPPESVERISVLAGRRNSI